MITDKWSMQPVATGIFQLWTSVLREGICERVSHKTKFRRILTNFIVQYNFLSYICSRTIVAEKELNGDSTLSDDNQ